MTLLSRNECAGRLQGSHNLAEILDQHEVACQIVKLIVDQISFRKACDDGVVLGTTVANNVLQNGMLTGHGNGDFFDGEQE